MQLIILESLTPQETLEEVIAKAQELIKACQKAKKKAEPYQHLDSVETAIDGLSSLFYRPYYKD